MDLKNLLNDQLRQQEADDESRQANEAQIKAEESNAANTSPSQAAKGAPIPVPQNFNYNYEFHSLLKQQLGTNSSLVSNNLPPNLSNLPFMQQFSQQPHMRNFLPFQQQVEQNQRTPTRNEWGRGISPNIPSNGATTPKQQLDQYQGIQPYKANEKTSRNGHQPSTEQPASVDPNARQQARQVPQGPTSYETILSLKTIERYKAGEIRNEVPIKEGDSVSDFPDTPTLVTVEAYEVPSTSWATSWKPDLLEKLFPEIYIRDQRAAKDVKRTLRDFRRHVDSTPQEDEIWYAKDIPIMHQSTCLNSKKNRNCMGCSAYWKCVQGINEDLRPWGNNDLLVNEPEHSETFLGHIGMNGSFEPQQIQPLACDVVNTMYYADDPNAVAIWGLISPMDLDKLSEEDGFGANVFEHRSFIDPMFLEKKTKVTYGLQKVGQTIVVPSGYVYWVVRVGRGLSFSASWNILRQNHIVDARRGAEQNRSLGIFKPLNISSLVISAVFQKIDELEIVENAYEKQQICDFLVKAVPILKTLVLEEILGEFVHISATTVLGYDMIVEKFGVEGRRSSDLSLTLANELMQVIELPLPALDTDVTDEDGDIQFSCNLCKYILFNTRRTCHTCKGYDLCEPCYSKHGKKHIHKMKRHRKTAIQTIIDLVESIRQVLHEHEQDERVSKDTKTSGRKRDRKEMNSTINKEEEQTENYDEEVIECICGNNKDLGFMISCEKCYAWLHGKCVGISKRNEPEVYYCPRCVKKPVVINAKLSPKDVSPEEKLKEYNLM